MITAGQQARSILPFEPFLFAERAPEFPSAAARPSFVAGVSAAHDDAWDEVITLAEKRLEHLFSLITIKGCPQLTRSALCREKHLLVERIDSIGEPPPTTTREQPATEPRRGAAVHPGVVARAMVARRDGGFAAAVAACPKRGTAPRICGWRRPGAALRTRARLASTELTNL